ncbi:hypothetical protein BLA29_011579, partial [Euroglyphus maynei]
MDSNMIIEFISLSLLLISIIGIDGEVTIRPEPRGEVGIMTGESKYFQCIGSNSKEKLYWINPRGQEISNDPNNGIYTIHIVKKNTIKLEIKNPAKQDSGVYKCVSRNEKNKETFSTSFRLHVFNPTILKATKESYQVNEGDNVRIDCMVKADKDANIEFMWTF